jgi:tRNA1Val (adenine37-N6)-methyltransferase
MEPFRFRKFTVAHDRCTHKVGTDGVLLGAWVRISVSDRNILDVGTGCGVIALMLAQRSGENTRIDAIEIEEQDARQAAENAGASPWKNRVKVHHTSLQNFLCEKQYDLIVSNPPYFTNSFLSDDKNRSRARHAHLLPYDDFLDHVVRMMNPKARLAVILPPAEGARMQELATTRGLSVIRTTQFRARKHKPVERILLEFAFVGTPVQNDELILYAEGNNWSDAYVKLTQDFYLAAGRD